MEENKTERKTIKFDVTYVLDWEQTMSRPIDQIRDMLGDVAFRALLSKLSEGKLGDVKDVHKAE